MSEIKTQPKHLRYLNPYWLEKEGRGIYGIVFDCPCGTPPAHCCNEHCNTPCPYAKWPGCAFGQMTIWFVDENNQQGSSASGEPNRWVAKHDGTFDSLTLTPSINAENHWHGFITNGVARSV